MIDKTIERLKRWSRHDQLRDLELLRQYGASSIDDLYGMIMAGRTAEPLPFWGANVLPARTVEKIIQLRKKIPCRAVEEAKAKEAYRNNLSSVWRSNHVSWNSNWNIGPTVTFSSPQVTFNATYLTGP